MFPKISDLAPATEKQISYILRLVQERETGLGEVTRELLVEGGLTKSAASAWIEALLAQPKKATASAPAAPADDEAEALEPGMYVTKHGTYVRVYPAKAGHLLAKELVEEDGEWGFRYMGAARRFARNLTRLSVEEAAKFGQQYGVCCVCGIELTDPESVAKGIGPICETRV